MEQCPFCHIIRGKAPAHVVHDSENILAILDIDPIQEGHVLILPKIHESSISRIPENVLEEMILAAQKICSALEKIYHPGGCSMMQNGGDFCDFGHVHLHIFPRYHGDGFGWMDPPGTFECSEKIAQLIKTNINSEV